MAAVAQYLVQDSFPVDKLRIDAQETKYYEIQSGCVEPSSSAPAASSSPSSLVSEIAKARQQIKQSLDDGTGSSSVAADNDVAARLNSLSLENTELKRVTDDLAALVKKLEARITALEGGKAPAPAPASAPKAVEKPVSKQEEKAEEDDDDDDDDDDIDLFGSDDSEDEEAKERIKEARVAAYNAKKAKKPVLIAKSSVLLDVKPWDDETDMAALEAEVRTIEMDGLLWGASKLVAVGYGIKKLQIMCVVEDEKVSIDDLSETICEFEDYVQSVDIAAFSKI